MELRQLVVFEAAAQTGGFTQAAHRLGAAQSAVSRTIRGLEEEFGVVLFDRSTHHVVLTSAGRLLLAEARRVLTAAEGLRETLDQVHSGLRGVLRVGVTQRDPSFPLPRLLAAFGAEYPGIEVQLRRGTTATHATRLRRGELDVAFISLRAYPGLSVTRLRRVPMRLICPADHPSAGRAVVELSDLAHEPFAEVPRSWGIRMEVDRVFGAAGVRRRVVYEVADVNSVVDFVQYGLAVAIVPPTVVPSGSDVRMVGLGEPVPCHSVSLATSDQRPPTAGARAFVQTALRLTDGPAQER